MVLHVRFESLYISLPSSARQREMTKFCVFSCLRFELNAVITYFAWASFKTDVRTEQIYTVAKCEGKIFILCHWASCLASLSSLLRLPIQFTSTHLYTCVDLHCESKGSCPRTQHNGPGQVPWPQLDWHNRSSKVCIKTPGCHLRARSLSRQL